MTLDFAETNSPMSIHQSSARLDVESDDVDKVKAWFEDVDPGAIDENETNLSRVRRILYHYNQIQSHGFAGFSSQLS